jgi:hypothetical protein
LQNFVNHTMDTKCFHGSLVKIVCFGHDGRAQMLLNEDVFDPIV